MTSSTPLFQTLGKDAPFAISFAGQGTSWQQELTDLRDDSFISASLDAMQTASDALLAPVHRELALIGGGHLDLSGPANSQSNLPSQSMPGILATQYGALLALAEEGFDLRRQSPVAVEGHSQGILASALYESWKAGDTAGINNVFAISRLIGSAATFAGRENGTLPVEDATPMLSVRGISRADLDPLLAPGTSVSLINGPDRFVVSGRPADLLRVVAAAKQREGEERQAIASKVRGGVAFSPIFDFIQVSAPFHSELHRGAFQQVMTWAKAAGLPLDLTERLASLVLLKPVDWPAQLRGARSAGARWILDLGPTDTLVRITQSNLEGTGVAVIPLGQAAARDRFLTVGYQAPKAHSWAEFAPKAITLPSGKTVVETKFSRLTGRSPILLAGMTPTTVDPEIVAAAANAGHWAELAGGGQVTEEVFATNMAELRRQLNPGQTAQFNAMFLDRYLWNLQFGTQSVVLKARAAGAPLEGVVISAGIPEVDEATTLIAQLRQAGLPYVAFKPGTVAQIRQVLAIAKANPGIPLIMQVEDGHAGGHHSWENLDDLLRITYAEIRDNPDVVLCVGGGIGTPQRAADYISGQWAQRFGLAPMPIDGVLVGTAAMTVKEALTTPEVKQMLLATEGVSAEDFNQGWIGSQQTRGSMTSGLSHLRADIHEIDNAAAACARLIADVTGDTDAIEARRDEIVAALDATSKPYFGDVDKMTYAAWARRFADLSYPWLDDTWIDRFLDLLHRVESRLSEAEHGQIPTLFPDLESVREPYAALEALEREYPQSLEVDVTPTDAAWFVDLCRKHPKPMPFVPVLDDDILRWWGQDNLWQSQDPRYTADQVRIIPGPVSVAGIDRVDEPVSELLGRFEQACVDRALESGDVPEQRFSRLGNSTDAIQFILDAPHIMWSGNLIENPAHLLPRENLLIEEQADNAGVYDVIIDFDTYWDGTPGGASNHAVRSLTIPLALPGSDSGAVPVVDRDTLPPNMYALLAATAGVGGKTITADPIEALPTMEPSKDSVFGEATWTFTVDRQLAAHHRAVTAESLPDDYQTAQWIPDALLGLCWPAIYAALGSALVGDYPVIEGLLSAVHLDHTAKLDVDLAELVDDGPVQMTVVARTVDLLESSSGRVVTVKETLLLGDREIGEFSERFAIRGRINSDTPPIAAPNAAGRAGDMIDTPRSVLRRARVTAPADMTPFANVSGDFNPIHTSSRAAVVAGLKAPLVHGMWLSAVAQNLVSADSPAGEGLTITGWTYNMYGLVNLLDVVDLTVERIGRLPGGGQVLEVTCKIDGQVVSRATATTLAPRTAYIYPGQGIQQQGMGLDEIATSAAARDVWDRADHVTREALGFSIISVVRDNPTELSSGTQTWRHPDGILNLTQFTQVALATVAFAQTARLAELNALVDGAYFAGHSLGEYTALSSYGHVIDLETVLEIVFHRGSTMHGLVERDAEGRSNYRMGALRPNQFGIDNTTVVDYVNGVAEASGEFLQIVNFNLADQQYAVAGTIKGLAALEADANLRAAEFGGKRAFMYVPGIDVPFHSRVLRGGVDEFRSKLLTLLPTTIDSDRLIGKYIPNLVARPFVLTREFAQSILDEVPSATIADLLDGDNWDRAMEDPDTLARLLLVELLCWQFASPVRWIETQDLLFTPMEKGGLGVQRAVEVGLASAPTLAGLADKTLHLAKFAGTKSSAFNLQRDEKVVTCTDVRVLFEDEDAEEAPAAPAQAALVAAAPQAEAAPAAAPAAAPVPVAAGSTERPADVPFRASDAIRVLMAYTNKLRIDQIADTDTTDTLTNGASARRNQLLMDLSAELGLASIDGAADATVAELYTSVDRLAHNYRAFGPVLTEAIRDRLRRLFGGAGVKPTRINERVTGTWQLGDGWVSAVTAEVLLGTREGDSVRGESLTTLPLSVASAAEADSLIDQAVQGVAAARGIAVAMPQSGGASGGVVDSAALDEFKAQLLGESGLLAGAARDLLEALGLSGAALLPEGAIEEDPDAALAVRVVDAVSAELGTGWIDMVTPSFSADKAILLDDRWATAREDLTRVWLDPSVAKGLQFVGAGEAVVSQAKWWTNKARSEGRADLVNIYQSIVDEASVPANGSYADDVALVTGVAPTSIAGAVVAKLLAGGATVIATASRIDASRLAYAKRLYRENAAPGAKLWLVPANLSSYRDVDALVQWIGSEQAKVVGPTKTVLKPGLVPTLFFPFAAPRVAGSLADAGEKFEAQTRLLLWSVERSIARLAELAQSSSAASSVHVVLPGSPNRGVFGGDGAYGETKSAFDAITNRWNVERIWADFVTIAHPRIGWVRGTGLMGGNDPLVDAAEAAGIHTYSTEEIASELMSLCSTEVRAQAATSPVRADLTGGLGDSVDLGALKAAAEAAAGQDVAAEAPIEPVATIPALPTPPAPQLAAFDAGLWADGTANPKDLVVVVGLGEVGTWGSARTRHQAELGIRPDGDVDLTPAGVLEMAWMMGLLRWQDSPVAGWYDAEDQLVPEGDIFDRFRDEVVARSGVRSFINDAAIEGLGTLEEAAVFLDTDVTFTVPDQATAESYVIEDPRLTRIAPTADGEWQVTRLAGAEARLPRRATLTRTVGGQLPTGFEASRWGIPAGMLEGMDRMTAWNLVTAVDAFLSAGFTPAELLRAVHPGDVASTQGTGFGGMTSMRKLFVDRFLGEEYPQDVLQETLPNVVAAHVMQSYVGGYGAMIHPVGACATAAVSVEEGVDKIATGKATFVVSGAIDDLSVESVVGFGSMNATANSEAMNAKGISERFYSRAGDRRRDGFIEAQGGGTILLARGDIAVEMGLPVLGVVGYAQSFADGMHTSIPAPGIGALAAARGGMESRFVRHLAGLGVTPDDIAVVSKHDTSTNANDPNEAELHERLAKAIGRTEGNPLYVISQKTLTGHAKGGAAVFQISGLMQLFVDGVVPANASLDCVDDAMARNPWLVWPRSPLALGEVGPIKAAVLTSLGFGHVSSLVAMIHPGAFEAAVNRAHGEQAGATWRERAEARLREGARRIEAGMLGRAALYEPTENRRFAANSDAHEVEAAMLLDPEARLLESGTFGA